MDNQDYEYQGEGVEQTVQQRFATPEEEERLRKKRQSRTKKIIGGIVAVVAVLVVVAMVCNGIYQSAIADWNRNDYLSAVVQFRKISFFRDAEDYTRKFESMLVEELAECSWSCAGLYNSKRGTMGSWEYTFAKDGTGSRTSRYKSDGEEKSRVSQNELNYGFLYNGDKLSVWVKYICEYEYTINLTQDADGVHIVNLAGPLEVGDDYWVTYNRSQNQEA